MCGCRARPKFYSGSPFKRCTCAGGSESVAEAAAERDAGGCACLLDRSAGDVRLAGGRGGRRFVFADERASGDGEDPPTPDEIRRAGQPTRAEWDSWSPDQRQAWARNWAAQQGALTARERVDIERRARDADYRFATDLVREGLGVVRDYIRESQETERERIRAGARRQGNAAADDRDAERSLLDDGDRGVTPTPTPAPAPTTTRGASKGSAVIPAAVAAALFFLR